MSRKLINTKDMPVDEWRKLRKKSLGGSDASVVVGLNNYRSSYTLWADKKGYLPDVEDNEAMRIGRDLEQYVADRFCEATGKKVKRRNYMFLHDKYDFISANIDREVVGENAGLECKTTNVFNKSDFDNGEIPLYYYCQCMHYMAVMGYEKMYLAVLVLGKAFYWFEVLRDDKEIEILINSEVDWWNCYISGGKVPQIDGSDSTERTINTLYPQDNKETIYDSSLKEPAELYLQTKAKIDELKKIQSEYEQKIKASMGEAEKCYISKYQVDWKSSNRATIDTKRLKKEKPDIYNEFLKVSNIRRFTIKEIKEV